MGWLERRALSPEDSSWSFGYDDKIEDEKELPALVEFMTKGAWEDGKSRVVGTLLLFVDDGKLKMCLSDRDQERVGFVTCSSLMTCLRHAEELLQARKVDWRPSRGSKRK